MAQKKKRGNKTVFILLIIIAALVLFVIVGRSAGWIGADAGKSVDIAKAEFKNIVETVAASGMVQPVTEVKISPEVPGEIVELYIEEGDSVAVGQALIKLKPDNFISALERTQASLNQSRANLAQARAAVETAQAQLRRAELEYQRQQKLYEDKVIPVAEFETAEANFQIAKNEYEAALQNETAARYVVQSAEASVKEAQENLGFTSIKAPMAGIVSKLNVERGEIVVGTGQMAGTEMLRIADLSNMEVRVDVNENDIVRVSLGDTANIDVDSYAFLNKKFKGVVTQIANSANDKASPDAVTEFEVRIKILNDSYKDLADNGVAPFRPGMTATVEIVTDKNEAALAVPLAAVTTRDLPADTTATAAAPPATDDDLVEVVFINDNGVARMKKVETGISDFNHIEITDGLEEGAEVISGPFNQVSKLLKDGDKITSSKDTGGSSR